MLKSQLYFVLNLRNLDIKETENTAIRGMVANDEESASIKAKTSYCTFLIGKKDHNLQFCLHDSLRCAE